MSFRFCKHCCTFKLKFVGFTFNSLTKEKFMVYRCPKCGCYSYRAFSENNIA